MTDEDKAAWEKHIKDRTRDGWAVFGDPLIFQAGRDSKPSNDWVKIEDIPDEWKDGQQPLFWYSPEQGIFYHGYYKGTEMWNAPLNPTHAMLRPQPPQQEREAV